MTCRNGMRLFTEYFSFLNKRNDLLCLIKIILKTHKKDGSVEDWSMLVGAITTSLILIRPLFSDAPYYHINTVFLGNILIMKKMLTVS